MVLLYQGRVAHLLRNMLVLRTSNFQGATIRPIVTRNKHSIVSGAHHQEPAATPYSCHGVFTDRSIFSLRFISNSHPHRNLSDQLQSQARNNVDMSTCSRGAALFYPYRSVPMYTGTDLFSEKII